MNHPAPREARNRRTATILALVALGMFGFGFALVPLYNLVCQSAGLQSIAVRTRADDVDPTQFHAVKDRELLVKFNAVVQPELPWDFYPEQSRILVHPGESYTVDFIAMNHSPEAVTGQAIPNIAPWQATAYFHKVECFCFSRQTLAGGKTVKMPLRFIVSPDLPEGIDSLTLSYSFMRLAQGDAAGDLAASTQIN